MKREILFRGKRVDNGEWVEGFYCGDHPFMDFSFIVIGSVEYKVKTETVGQFTGLTDKNGVKIFEGDILKKEYRTESFILTVSWGENGFVFKCENDYSDNIKILSTSKIIGNIHDNKDLL